MSVAGGVVGFLPLLLVILLTSLTRIHRPEGSRHCMHSQHTCTCTFQHAALSSAWPQASLGCIGVWRFCSSFPAMLPQGRPRFSATSGDAHCFSGCHFPPRKGEKKTNDNERQEENAVHTNIFIKLHNSSEILEYRHRRQLSSQRWFAEAGSARKNARCELRSLPCECWRCLFFLRLLVGFTLIAALHRSAGGICITKKWAE